MGLRMPSQSIHQLAETRFTGTMEFFVDVIAIAVCQQFDSYDWECRILSSCPHCSPGVSVVFDLLMSIDRQNLMYGATHGYLFHTIVNSVHEQARGYATIQSTSYAMHDMSFLYSYN